jgi:predicted nucleic acid-binding protein
MVALEILAGARDDLDRDRLRRLIYSQTLLPVEGPADYENAAELYRACRRGGETPRGLADCLIAVVAIRNDVELLCCDADFQVIARHAPLRLLGA